MKILLHILILNRQIDPPIIRRSPKNLINLVPNRCQISFIHHNLIIILHPTNPTILSLLLIKLLIQKTLISRRATID